MGGGALYAPPPDRVILRTPSSARVKLLSLSKRWSESSSWTELELLWAW